jgi:abnormal spindle-like microcephaly-associated protein
MFLPLKFVFQAVRRARKVRKTSSAILQQLLKRIKEADSRARADPSLKLGKQTSAALKVLQTGKMISQLLKACQTLELSTSLSRYCCEAFAQAGAPNILFSLLRSCNRSTPHQELLRYEQ